MPFFSGVRVVMVWQENVSKLWLRGGAYYSVVWQAGGIWHELENARWLYFLGILVVKCVKYKNF